jgi:geranylgeranylglycerol-phosphate geranylgeranyltransferase
VVVAAFICNLNFYFSLNILLAALAASFTLASGNIINDIYDVEIDKINRSSRPLPSGIITFKSAYIFYIILILISLVLSWLVDIQIFVIVLVSQILLFLYSKSLKRIPLLGNITVAFLTGFVFIYGGIVVDSPEAAIIPAVYAFLINLIREIVKDLEDVEGDNKVGVKTFPIQFGFQKSKILILLLTITLILYTIYPFLSHLYKIEYFVMVMIIVNPVLVYSIKLLFENHSLNNLNRISSLLKLSMVFGLIAIYLGV